MTKDLFSVDALSQPKLDFVESGIVAGFPSPAEDYCVMSLDLNKELVKNPASTFYARVKGSSMIGVGLDDGDLLVIDKSIEPYNAAIAVCFIDGEFTVRRLKMDKNEIILMPENSEYKP